MLKINKNKDVNSKRTKDIINHEHLLKNIGKLHGIRKRSTKQNVRKEGTEQKHRSPPKKQVLLRRAPAPAAVLVLVSVLAPVLLLGLATAVLLRVGGRALLPPRAQISPLLVLLHKLILLNKAEMWIRIYSIRIRLHKIEEYGSGYKKFGVY